MLKVVAPAYFFLQDDVCLGHAGFNITAVHRPLAADIAICPGTYQGGARRHGFVRVDVAEDGHQHVVGNEVLGVVGAEVFGR